MHIDRELLNRTRVDLSIKGSLTLENTDVTNELLKIMPIIESHLIESDIQKSSNWMLFKDLWMQNELGYLKTSVTYRNYDRGSVIMSVDWGTGNIGTEIRYPHPGVVLLDRGEDWLIAAPITSARVNFETKQPISHPPFDVLAFRQNKQPENPSEYWFKKHSVIQIDQLQRISKHRITYKKSYKLNGDLLKQIDNIILEYLIPNKFRWVEGLKELLLKQNADLALANEEIVRLREELKELKTTK